MLCESFSSKDTSLYQKVFFGSSKYPTWSGYAIGYYLIEKFIKNTDLVSWQSLMKKSPEEIKKAAGF